MILEKPGEDKMVIVEGRTLIIESARGLGSYLQFEFNIADIPILHTNA